MVSRYTNAALIAAAVALARKEVAVKATALAGAPNEAMEIVRASPALYSIVIPGRNFMSSPGVPSTTTPNSSAATTLVILAA